MRIFISTIVIGILFTTLARIVDEPLSHQFTECKNIKEVYGAIGKNGNDVMVLVDYFIVYNASSSSSREHNHIQIKRHTYQNNNMVNAEQHIKNYFNKKDGVCRVKDVVIYPVIVAYEYKIDSDE